MALKGWGCRLSFECAFVGLSVDMDPVVFMSNAVELSASYTTVLESDSPLEKDVPAKRSFCNYVVAQVCCGACKSMRNSSLWTAVQRSMGLMLY